MTKLSKKIIGTIVTSAALAAAEYFLQKEIEFPL